MQKLSDQTIQLLEEQRELLQAKLTGDIFNDADTHEEIAKITRQLKEHDDAIEAENTNAQQQSDFECIGCGS